MDVPSSIGDLKYLRYLNLSKNPNCQALPDSITKLVNLLTLDISSCWSIVALPNDIGKLISLRHLVISDCDSMNQMPPGFGELTSLQHLSDFKVGKRGDDGHGTGNVLGALVGLNLQGSLRICFDSDGVWSEDELMIHIPESVEMLSISDYPGKRIPVWWKEDSSLGPLKLMSLELRSCGEVKHLPPLARLPFLRDLTLVCFHELECIQQVVAEQIATANEELSFFPLLTHLKIIECFLLKSIPPCPRLVSAYLVEVSGEMVHQLVSNSLPSRHTNTCLQRITVFNCGDLTSFPGEGLTSLRRLKLRNCPSLRNVQLASNALEELIIRRCPDLELWDHRGVRWASLSNIRLLAVDKIPKPDELPDCLRRRLALSKLHIQEL